MAKEKLNRPPDALLAQNAPLHVWRHAEKQAARSPHRRHRTGAVIFDERQGIVSKGCAHPHDGSKRTFSTHAEIHAIGQMKAWGQAEYMVIVTLTKTDNYASTSRPCRNCNRNLIGRVNVVMYAERTTDGDWAIVRREPEDMAREFLMPTRMMEDAN
jgi:deoxycytidylate deaminase